MIQKELNAVQAFHQAFKIGCAAQPTVDLPDQIKELRFRLMEEENQEYLEAAKNKARRNHSRKTRAEYEAILTGLVYILTCHIKF